MKRFINKICHEILRFTVKIKKIRYGLNQEKRNEKIIVTFTSFPERFPNIHLCIKSLLFQSVKPDKIVLYLGCDSSNDDIEKYLKKYEKYGLTIIKDSEKNIRSHKKYFYALSQFENYIVITVDDDLIYPKDMIESLIKKYIEYPDCIIGRRVHKIVYDNDNISKYKDWVEECSNVKGPSHELFVTTGAGTLFPPKMKKDDLLNLDLIYELCPTADDVWINFIAIKNNIKRVWAENKLQMPTTIEKSQEISLVKVNVGENLNDKYVEKIVKKFNIKF